MMTEASRTYLPAAGHDWLLPLYDPIVKLLGGDAARRALIDKPISVPDLVSSKWAAVRAR
jgi:hypothetical protein